MFRAYGLYSHIQANRIRSALLLAGFVALLHALLFSLLLLWSALYGGTFDEIVADAWWQFRQSWPVAMLAAAIWFAIAYFIHQWLVRMATGAKDVARAEAPRLYNCALDHCQSHGSAASRLRRGCGECSGWYARDVRRFRPQRT
jgi:heat shock protein HtpX